MDCAEKDIEQDKYICLKLAWQILRRKTNRKILCNYNLVQNAICLTSFGVLNKKIL